MKFSTKIPKESGYYWLLEVNGDLSINKNYSKPSIGYYNFKEAYFDSNGMIDEFACPIDVIGSDEPIGVEAPWSGTRILFGNAIDFHDNFDDSIEIVKE